MLFKYWLMLLPIFWLILLPYLWQMLLPYCCGGCFYHFYIMLIFMADVIAILLWWMFLPHYDIFDNVFIGWCYCQLLLWQILLPSVCGWCYYHFVLFVIAFSIARWQMLLPWYVDDGKPHFVCLYCIFGWCYCHGGRWNNHLGWDLFGRCYGHSGWWNCHWSALF